MAEAEGRDTRITYHVGVSGGKDSTAVLLWMVRESGIPSSQIIASFCDTGNEADETYAHVAMLSERVHPIIGVTPEYDFWELARHKKRFPSARARFCTQRLKMEPTKAFVDWLEEERGGEVVMVSGVRASESDDRAKLPEWGEPWLSYFGRREWRPLLRWSLADVWAIHARHDIPPNPLYAMGCRRVGCLPCVMSRKAEIRNISERWPERIEFIRSQERSVQNPSGYSSMFAADKTPSRYRTRPITTKAGEQMNVCTIDDVVRWSRDVTLEFDFFDGTGEACDARYGSCE